MQDVLIPGRFFCFILQILLTLSIFIGREDFISAIVTKDENKDDYKKEENAFIAYLSIFCFFELIEFVILILGYTLFINLLSLAQIFFHSIAVLLLNWFYRDVWESDEIYIPFIIGGIIPFILEIYNLIILCQSNRIISKIH